MRKLQALGLHEQVIKEIGNRIVGGEFVPGLALPGESKLCDALGVSRTVLREALRVLASKGLVEPRRKIGTLVLPTERWNFLDSDVLSWQIEASNSERVIDELYELRHLIEPIAASLAAQRARAADLKVLRGAYEEMCAAGDDGEQKVLDAIANHDASAARVAMQRLIEDSQHDAQAVRRAATRRLVRATPDFRRLRQIE